jgi:hypothetical protein
MNKTRLLGVGTLAVLLVAVCGNTVLRGQTGAISACAQVVTGALRVVAPGAACLPTERPLAWSVEGIQGPQGPEGPQGPQGSQGPAGNTNVLTYKLTNAVAVNQFLTPEIPGFGTFLLTCLSNGQPRLSVFSPGAYRLHRRNVDDATSFTQIVNAGTGFVPLVNDPPGPAGRSIDTVWISTGSSDLSPVWKLDYLTHQRDFASPCVVAVTVTAI